MIIISTILYLWIVLIIGFVIRFLIHLYKENRISLLMKNYREIISDCLTVNALLENEQSKEFSISISEILNRDDKVYIYTYVRFIKKEDQSLVIEFIYPNILILNKHINGRLVRIQHIIHLEDELETYLKYEIKSFIGESLNQKV